MAQNKNHPPEKRVARLHANKGYRPTWSPAKLVPPQGGTGTVPATQPVQTSQSKQSASKESAGNKE